MPESTAEHPDYVAACGALTDVDRFDAGYFGYSPRDAALLDPQQRLFLQTAVHALEHAGYADRTGAAPVGVYAGTSISTYLLRHLITNAEVTRNAGYSELILGNDQDTLATRVSYHLDLQGPSVTVQTACSTSLVAVHLACPPEACAQGAVAGGRQLPRRRERLAVELGLEPAVELEDVEAGLAWKYVHARHTASADRI